ncbi:MAG: bacteriohemerythrin [Candidatus Riflebacteria bacterium]|nr:bacteriohemerythrin [Candidatus Riflebacteria bacterium]
MEWDQSFSIGCDIVDSQHKELICLVDQLESSLENRLVPQQLGAALKFIVNYTRHHFSAEEAFMETIGFDELENHKKLHNNLIKEVTDILLSLKHGENLNSEDLVKFLVDWVLKHVQEEDQKIGIFARKKKHLAEQSECKLKAVNSRRQLILTRLEKLKGLFKQKLIEIEDFKEQKVKTLANMLKELGLNQLRAGFDDLDYFLSQDVICKNERKAIVVAFLQKSDLQKGLSEIIEIEDKLLYLRSFHEFEMITDNKFDSLKAEILDTVC